jgi:hypothetical protein
MSDVETTGGGDGGGDGGSSAGIYVAVALLGACAYIAPAMKQAAFDAARAVANVEGIHKAGQEWAELGNALEEVARSVKTAVSYTEHGWTTQDKTAFVEAAAAYQKELMEMKRVMEGVGGMLGQASQAYSQLYTNLLITATITLAILIILNALRSNPFTAAFAESGIQMIGTTVPMIIKSMIGGTKSTLDQVGQQMCSLLGTKPDPDKFSGTFDGILNKASVTDFSSVGNLFNSGGGNNSGDLTFSSSYQGSSSTGTTTSV